MWVMGLTTKNGCACEGQQQIAKQEVRIMRQQAVKMGDRKIWSWVLQGQKPRMTAGKTISNLPKTKVSHDLALLHGG
jgi:hypothetical protein